MVHLVNNKAAYKIVYTQQTITMTACGYDLFPVQQLKFARLELPKLKEYNRVYSNLKLWDTFKHIKWRDLTSFLFGDKLLQFWHPL